MRRRLESVSKMPLNVDKLEGSQLLHLNSQARRLSAVALQQVGIERER